MSMFRVGAEASSGPGGRIKSPRTPPSSVGRGRGIAPTDAGTQDQPEEERGPADVFGSAIDLLTKWIPTETIAFYAPGIVVLAEGGEPPSVIWLILMALISPLFVLVGTFSTGSQIDMRKTAVSAALGLGAFLLWSLTIPGSGWYRWDTLADNQAVVPIAGALLATLYSGVAEGVQRRTGAEPAGEEGGGGAS